MTQSEGEKPEIRGLKCGASRSTDFQAGHRLALRSAVAWLHAEAARMNDPKARDVLNAAADGLGAEARNLRHDQGLRDI